VSGLKRCIINLGEIAESQIAAFQFCDTLLTVSALALVPRAPETPDRHPGAKKPKALGDSSLYQGMPSGMPQCSITPLRLQALTR